MMRVAQRFAGYSLAEADNLRKACGKKKRELMAKERASFEAGCERTGYGRDLGATLFDIIEQFADYAFNKSHSYGYGYIAYQTAYLKAHYPVEYLAALLTSVKGTLEKAAVYLAECRSMGIKVLVPDVNRSSSDFVPARLDDGEEVIPFGLSAVRNVGAGLVEQIVAEREANGPFADFFDFCDRVDLQVLNKRAIESLIKAGGFDSLGHKRRGLLTVFESIIDKTVARRREHDMGVMTLFGEADSAVSFDDRPAIPDVEFDKRDRLAFEKEMLGLYVSDHPLLGAEAALRRKTDGVIADIAEAEEGSIRTYGGVVTALQKKYTKAGDLMAVFTLEDLQGTVEVMVFPKAMAVFGFKLVEDAIVVVKGRVDRRDDRPKLMAMDVEVFDGISDGSPPVRIQLPGHELPVHLVDRLKTLIDEHPGSSPVFLHVGPRNVLKLPDRYCVDATNGFAGEVRVLLGPDSLL
jgi:DNA polymerase-3 subunit alpha